MQDLLPICFTCIFTEPLFGFNFCSREAKTSFSYSEANERSSHCRSSKVDEEVSIPCSSVALLSLDSSVSKSALTCLNFTLPVVSTNHRAKLFIPNVAMKRKFFFRSFKKLSRAFGVNSFWTRFLLISYLFNIRSTRARLRPSSRVKRAWLKFLSRRSSHERDL